ncbi:MAG: DHH family phosphoesterase [Clostridia bacterium]|nr:DHH family phosphoesterase [Clostridia bacterium]
MKNTLFSKIKNYRNELIAIVLMVMFFAVCAVKIDVRAFYIGIVFLLIYLSFLAAFYFAGKKKSGEKSKKEKILNNVSVEFLMNLDSPVAILDDEGVILWYNQKFMDDKESKALYGTNINDLLETKFNLNHLKESLCDNSASEPLYASLSGVKYKVLSYRHAGSFGGDNFYITVWYDMTDVQKLEEKLYMRNPVVMYIYIDNFYDAGGTMVNNYRTVTAKVSTLLYEWIGGLNGIVREFERDKYVAIFDREYLAQLTDSKFDILDKVRELCEKETDTLATLSIGVACLEDATLAEKNDVAHQAIDLAMQRGGDQAVIKFNDSSEFYGGRFKTVQKRTKIRSRIIAQDLIRLIANSSNVLIMGHKFADHDSIGSCVGIARLALEYNPKVNIVVNMDDANVKRLSDKIASMDKYTNVFVDAYKGQDLVSQDTLLVVCDVNNAAIFESRDIYENVKDVVVIDHHRKTGDFIVEPRITYIEPSASSASELVSEILEQVTPPGSLLKEEAELLFAGMVLDTKQFSKNTGVRTFSAALYLRGEGASPSEINAMFKSSFEDFSREARFINNVVIYRDIIAISVLEEDGTSDDKISASRVADKLLEIDGVLASFALCNIGEMIHISSRSIGTVNVQLILEKLNGGGHFDSAGAQVSDASMADALQLLKQAIDEYLDTEKKDRG